MPFDKHGFLGQEIGYFANEISDGYKDEIKLVYDINDFAQDLKFKFEINRHDSQQLLAAGLLVRVINAFQSSVILCERGLVSDAKVVLRSNIQAICILKLICQNPDFIKEYALSQKVEQLKLMNVILDDRDNVFSGELKDAVTKEHRDKLRKEIKDNNIKSLTVEELARKADLTSFYQTAYRSLSSDEHISPQTLNRYYTLDNDGEIKFLECIPQSEGITTVLATGISIMLVALDVTSKLFGMNIDDEIEVFQNRHFSLKWTEES